MTVKVTNYRLKPKPGVKAANIVMARPAVRLIPKAPTYTVKQKEKILAQRQISKSVVSKKHVLQKRRVTDTRKKFITKNRTLNKYLEAIERLKDKGKGRTLIMLACGPSILEIDTSKFKGLEKVDIMAINKPDLRVFPTTYWAFCDHSQYMRNQDLWNTYNGTIINSAAVRVRRPNQILIKNKSGAKFSRDLKAGYHIGRSTVFANMQTALWMGYSKVYIFGIDMTKVGAALHFYGVNPDVKEKTRESRFKKEAENYETAAKELNPEERKRFVFCSSYNKWPFVKRFVHMGHQEAFEEIIDNYNQK